MTHNNDDLQYYTLHQETSQNPNAPSPRGSYADEALSVLSQQYRPPMHNLPSSSSSSHSHFHSSTEQSSLTVDDARLAGSGPFLSHNRFTDPHGVGGGRYCPGHDPPTPVTPSQPGWPMSPNHPDAYLSPHLTRQTWVPASPSASPEVHGLMPAVGYYTPLLRGQPHQFFEGAFELGNMDYTGRAAFASPGDGSGWSPDSSQGLGYFLPPTGPPPTPSGALDTTQERALSPRSVHSATPSGQSPFGLFPDQDPARDMAYQEHGDRVDDFTMKGMLGLTSRINCSCDPERSSLASPEIHTLPLAIETDSSGARLDHTQPSSSLRVFDAQGTVRPVQLGEDVEAHFPNAPGLKKLALYILNQAWCAQNLDEPPIKSDELVVTLKFQKRNPKTRFEPFFDEKMRCRVVEANGARCEHITTRKDRAVGHARAHFGYKPFACSGKCGKQGCQERYICSSFRNDHVGRKKNPKRPCPTCQKLYTAQNLQRHMKQHDTSPPTPQTEEPLRKKPKISILRALGRK